MVKITAIFFLILKKLKKITQFYSLLDVKI